MIFILRRFWICCILIAAIGCQDSAPTPTRLESTRENVTTPELDTREAKALEEEKAEAALNFKLPVSPLTNFPEVTESIFTKLKVGNWNGDVADVTVKNVGDSTLIYGGYPGFGPTSEMV